MFSSLEYVTSAISGVAMFVGVTQFTEALWSDPPPTDMVIYELKWDDGAVVQRLGGSDGNPVVGDWTATFWRHDETDHILCRGSNAPGEPGTYMGELQRYTPDEWTGDDCPTLVSGDRGVAAWTYVNDHGLRVTVAAEFYIPGDAR